MSSGSHDDNPNPGSPTSQPKNHDYVCIESLRNTLLPFRGTLAQSWMVDLIGVVVDILGPKKSKGRDLFVQFTLVDPFQLNPDANNFDKTNIDNVASIDIIFFVDPRKEFPPVFNMTLGDVVRIHRVRTSFFNPSTKDQHRPCRLQGYANRNTVTSILVFDSHTIVPYESRTQDSIEYFQPIAHYPKEMKNFHITPTVLDFILDASNVSQQHFHRFPIPYKFPDNFVPLSEIDPLQDPETKLSTFGLITHVDTQSDGSIALELTLSFHKTNNKNKKKKKKYSSVIAVVRLSPDHILAKQPWETKTHSYVLFKELSITHAENQLAELTLTKRRPRKQPDVLILTNPSSLLFFHPDAHDVKKFCKQKNPRVSSKTEYISNWFAYPQTSFLSISDLLSAPVPRMTNIKAFVKSIDTDPRKICVPRCKRVSCQEVIEAPSPNSLTHEDGSGAPQSAKTHHDRFWKQFPSFLCPQCQGYRFIPYFQIHLTLGDHHGAEIKVVLSGDDAKALFKHQIEPKNFMLNRYQDNKIHQELQLINKVFATLISDTSLVDCTILSSETTHFIITAKDTQIK